MPLPSPEKKSQLRETSHMTAVLLLQVPKKNALTHDQFARVGITVFSMLLRGASPSQPLPRVGVLLPFFPPSLYSAPPQPHATCRSTCCSTLFSPIHSVSAAPHGPCVLSTSLNHRTAAILPAEMASISLKTVGEGCQLSNGQPHYHMQRNCRKTVAILVASDPLIVVGGHFE